MSFKIYNVSQHDQFPTYFPGNPKTLMRPQGAMYTRTNAAVLEYGAGFSTNHPTNGDENRYSNKIGNYSKGLPHNALGEVDLVAYDKLLYALSTHNPVDFEAIPLGGTVKLTNPQSGLCFDLEGKDPFSVVAPIPAAFSSNELATEIIENYWMALCRDVHFFYYDNNSTSEAAIADLNNLPLYNGPKVGGLVTPGTLFRGSTPGDLIGPYISQFLYLDVPFGALSYDQKMRTYLVDSDELTDYNTWLNIQNGAAPVNPEPFAESKRYIINGRDLSEWVHMDVLYQAYFQAMLIMLGNGYPLSPTNPYRNSSNQIGFGTFGGPHIATLMTEVATRSLKCAWFQKWNVTRRLRPEEFGGCIHLNLTGQTAYPISSILNTTQPALERTENIFGTYLLPQAYREGCPTHPSCVAGHASVAGACVTILKAFFDESYIIPTPKMPDDTGDNLLDFVGPPLTVGNELNKLAANISLGRSHAGVHFRDEYWNSVLMGQQIAVSILTDQKGIYNENFTGWSFTGFEGNIITI